MRKGSTLTDEQKRKISESKKGQIPWNKGRKMTLLEIRKNSSAQKNSLKAQANIRGLAQRVLKGGKLSLEHRKKISLANQGHKVSQKTIDALIQRNKKKVWTLKERQKLSSYQQGKKMPDSTRQKLIKAHANPQTKLKNRMAHLGKKMPESFAKKRAIYLNRTDVIKKFKELRLNMVIPAKDTKPEKLLQRILSDNGIVFTKHKAILGQPDVFIEPNICIFADGDYWHGWFRLQGQDFSNQKKFNNEYFENKIKRDLAVKTRLESQGFKVLRLWEHEIYQDPQKCLQRIRDLVSS